MTADIEEQQGQQVVEEMRGDEADLTAKSAMSKNSKESARTKVSLSVNRSVLELVESHNARELDDDRNQRKTQLYCGFCCDVLTASFVVDCMYVPWMIMSTFFNLGLLQDAKELMLLEDTDDTDDTSDGSSGVNPLILIAIKNVLGVPFGLIGILGAWKMYKWCVLVTGIWFCVDLVWSCVFKRYVMLALVFNIYPHFALFEALWSGKITRENFRARERRCCCCRDTDK